MAASPGTPPPADASGEAPWVAVNGERCALPAGGALVDLLATLQIDRETRGVAVAVNDELVPGAQWAGCRLQAGDRVEIVRAVQGG